MRKLLLVMVLATALTLCFAGAALAADVGATVQGENAAPTVTSVTLKTSDETPAQTSAMTPQTEYRLEVVAGDDNSIGDITEIKVTIYHDATAEGVGTLGTDWDADQNAIFKWTPTGDWTMERGDATTTWTLESASSEPSDMTGTSGTWKLAFKPGKLAKVATGSDTDEWVCYAAVTDAASASGAGNDDLNSMGAYVEIATDAASIGFGEVAPDGTAAIQTPTDHNLATKVTTNKAYALAVAASTSWSTEGTPAKTMTLNTSGTPGNRQFALAIDDVADGNGVPASPQWISTTSAQITGMTGIAAPTTDTDLNKNEGTSDKTLYMQIDLGNVLPGAYSGTVTFTASN